MFKNFKENYIEYFKKFFKKYLGFDFLRAFFILFGIVLLVDMLNIPSSFILRFGMHVFWALFFIILIQLIIFLCEVGVIDSVKIKAIHQTDKFIFGMLLFVTLYFICLLILNLLCIYKIIVLSIIFVLCNILICIRAQITKTVANEMKQKIIDLKELYECDNISQIPTPVLISEKAVNYDLLYRTSIINFLYNSIISAEGGKKFVISLEGKWGCGKTTVLNNVKRMLVENPEIIIIDEFDPWVYKNEKKMFECMFNLLLSKSGYKYKYFSVEKYVSAVSGIIFGEKNGQFFQSILSDNNLFKIKNEINDYLKSCDKNYVFIIDNLDRTESENIITFFNIISNVLDFDRIIYIISFDDLIINQIYGDSKRHFLKKIIDLQIRMPKIDIKIYKDIIQKCFYKTLRKYGESENELQEYEKVVDFMSDNEFDLRDFKFFVNSTLYNCFNNSPSLNNKDLVIIEFIKHNNFPLYQMIYDKRQFFISQEKTHNPATEMYIFHTDSFSKEAKEVFDSIFSNIENSKYKELMSELFPYIERYCHNKEIVSKYIYSGDNSIQENLQNRRICSGDYFDLYFTFTSNDFLETQNASQKAVLLINSEGSISDKCSEFKKILNTISVQRHKELIENLYFSIKYIQPKKGIDFIKILFENYVDIYNETLTILAISARYRAAAIIQILLESIPEEDFNQFIDYVDDKYLYLRLLDDIFYWYQHAKDKVFPNRIQLYGSKLNELARRIVETHICIYDNNFYMQGNLYGLYGICKNNNLDIKEYMNIILNGNNIYRFLYDIINVRIMNGEIFKYYYIISNITRFTSIEKIDEIIKETPPRNDNELLLVDAYKYKYEKEDDKISDKCLEMKQEMNFKL
ncbi:P-loop NTPase fold protein [Solobacterium moorei]|uniref:KAP family P-loop NTPase fold protein n=1 Tax=Solobacterium moorei TaxID=102148 RepID=UPI0023F1907C|nr:P-loop NTPase fold protein [Solobacterium moorei]